MRCVIFKVHRFKEQETGWSVKQNVKQPLGLRFGGADFFPNEEEKTSSGALKMMMKREEIWKLESGEGE